MKRVLVAGGSGYLGGYMIKALYKNGYDVVAVVRSENKISPLRPFIKQLVVVDISQPKALEGIMKDIDMVFTSVGITRQKDGVTYMDVDYQCNRNLLDEALKSGVKKFMYVAALGGDKLMHLKIMQAKERFVKELIHSGISSYVIRPSGFYSDITEVYKMAQKGKVYVVGKGKYRVNPIHGEDLAEFCVQTYSKANGVYPVGGPEIFTQTEMGYLAFNIIGNKAVIKKVPKWLITCLKRIIVFLTSEAFYGPIEFFMTVLTQDMVGPRYGNIRLKTYFESLGEQYEQG